MPNIGDKVRVIPGPHKSGEFYQGLTGTVIERFEFEQGAQNKLLVRNEGPNTTILDASRDYHTSASEMVFWFNDHELEVVE